MATLALGNDRTFVTQPDPTSVPAVLNSGSMMSATPQDPGAQATGGTQDAYTKFNQNLASILTQIQKAQAAGTANLGGARDALTSESVTAAGPYDKTMTPDANIAALRGMPGAFAPAVTSVNTQLENTNTGIANLGTEIGALETAYKPIAVSPGQSLVTPDGTRISQGHSYTPQINPNTGLLDGFDQNTGTWSSQDRSGAGGTAGGASHPGISDAVEKVFGKSNPIGAYATDPNYVSEISGLYQTISGLNVAGNPEALQAYIDNNAKGAPVTAAMIQNAASTYGLDPALLTTVLLHESDFGTAGAGAKTMNPGNQGNTGTSTQSYNSWQQGVLATAKNLSNRINAVQNQPAAAPAAAETSPVGGAFSAEAGQKVSQLPQALQSYADAGPLGVAYINDDRVPDNMKQSLQILASRAGIPYVQPSDVNALKSIEAVLGNLNSMQALANKNLNSGILGHAEDSILGGINQAAQTDWGNQLGLFDNYRDTAIKAVQALAGGAGSGLRINGAEIAANTQNLPSASDSKENALLQVKQLKQLIYTQLATTFPYAKVQVQDANGNSGTIPAGNLNAAISRGASVI